MARIFLSPLIVDIRNKQSDTVFSKWKGINYIRSRVIPHNPKTATQVAVRESLAQLVALWQQAYPSVKLNWDEWASGRDYSGFNKFIGKNVINNRDEVLIDLTQEVGFTKITAWAAVPGSGSGEIDVSWIPTPVPANTDLELHIREKKSTLWEDKITYAAAVASPQTITGLTPGTTYEIYGYFVNDTTPTGDEVGDDQSDAAAATV